MERLKQLRKEKKLKQEEVAKVLGISVSAYGNYEIGQRTPGPEYLVKLADFYNVTTDYILERTDSRELYVITKDPAPTADKFQQYTALLARMNFQQQSITYGFMLGLLNEAPAI